MFSKIYELFFGPREEEVVEVKPSIKSEEELYSMTKKEIDEYAETLGVKLDRRKTKKTMIDTFLSQQ